MKMLICTGGGGTSAETIRFGIAIARSFNADVSLLYVQPTVPHAIRQEMKLAREKLKEWNLGVPGFEVLDAAQSILLDAGHLKTTVDGKVVQKYPLKAGVRGAYELVLSGARDENVRLRLREGDIISEVNAEVESDQHDLVIFGASQKRRLLHKLTQFINCSILIVKNPRKDRYRLLICTDSTPASRKAEVFGTRLAQMIQSDVMLLSVARSRNSEHAAMEEAERISKSMAKSGIRHSIAIRVGSMPDAIGELAKEDTMVVMGAAQISEIRKFFFGSIPAKVIDRVNCPVLIVQ